MRIRKLKKSTKPALPGEAKFALSGADSHKQTAVKGGPCALDSKNLPADMESR
jgi:hypothetical protein